MSILIKGALLDSAVTDVYIEKKEIRQIGADLQVQAERSEIDARGCLLGNEAGLSRNDKKRDDNVLRYVS